MESCPRSVVAAVVAVVLVWAAAGCPATRTTAPPVDETLIGPLSMATDGDRLMPRLALPSLRAELPQDADLPYSAVDSLGLEVLYALDAEDSVRYLTRADLQQLGITQEELHDRAMANLRKTFSGETVKDCLDGRKLISIKCMDSYDATRLLLLPAHLGPGDELVAVIPDRDTLVFAAVEPGFDWRTFDELANTPVSDKALLAQPLRVTHEGFELK